MDGGLDIRGLSEKEAAARLKAEGPNTLPQGDRRTFLRIVRSPQRQNPLRKHKESRIILGLLGAGSCAPVRRVRQLRVRVFHLAAVPLLTTCRGYLPRYHARKRTAPILALLSPGHSR